MRGEEPVRLQEEMEGLEEDVPQTAALGPVACRRSKFHICPQTKKTPPQIDNSASAPRLKQVLKESWREVVISRPVWDHSLLRRCEGMNSKRGSSTVAVVCPFLWTLALAVTQGSFDRNTMVLHIKWDT